MSKNRLPRLCKEHTGYDILQPVASYSVNIILEYVVCYQIALNVLIIKVSPQALRLLLCLNTGLTCWFPKRTKRNSSKPTSLGVTLAVSVPLLGDDDSLRLLGPETTTDDNTSKQQLGVF